MKKTIEATIDNSINESTFNPEEDYPWEMKDTKSIKDSDGFMTDYTWYHNQETGEHVFILGDREFYDFADYPDYECDSESEAKEWFDDYDGATDEDDSDNYSDDDFDDEYRYKKLGLFDTDESINENNDIDITKKISSLISRVINKYSNLSLYNKSVDEEIVISFLDKEDFIYTVVLKPDGSFGDAYIENLDTADLSDASDIVYKERNFTKFIKSLV